MTHETTVVGDYKVGWRWQCTCGKVSALHGETGAPRRQGNEHARKARLKDAS